MIESTDMMRLANQFGLVTPQEAWQNERAMYWRGFVTGALMIILWDGIIGAALWWLQ